MSTPPVLRRLLPLAIYPMLEILFFISACLSLDRQLPLFLISFLLAAVFLSYSIHITFHECVHSGLKFEGPFALLRGLISILAGIPLNGYRAHHFNHHRFGNAIEDYSSTWVRKNGATRPRHFFIYGLGWPASFWRARNGLNAEIQSGRLSVSVQRQIRQESRIILIFIVVLTISAWKYALMYLALIYFGWVLTSWHNYIQHPPISMSALITTSFSGKLYNLCFANNGLHWEHHNTPGTPWNELEASPDAPRVRIPGLKGAQ